MFGLIIGIAKYLCPGPVDRFFNVRIDAIDGHGKK
jgi:vancomycin permeability regulator SanA